MTKSYLNMAALTKAGAFKTRISGTADIGHGGRFAPRLMLAPDGDGGGGDGDEPSAEAKQLLEKMKTELDANLNKRGLVVKGDFDKWLKDIFGDMEPAQIRTFLDDKKALDKQVRSLAKQLAKLEDSGLSTERRDMSVRGQIATFLENKENRAKLTAFRAGEIKAFEMPLILEHRAAGTMLVGTHTGDGTYLPKPEFIPGLVDIARQEPFLEDLVDSASTGSATLVWVEKINPDGNAEFLGEGGLKPLIDFKVLPKTSNAKKVADKIKASTEMIEDIDFMAAEIEKELRYKVDIKVDEQLLIGDGTGDNIFGIDHYAGGYVLVGIETTEPNNMDAIRSMATQVRMNFQRGTIVALVNPVDRANMDMAKASDGHYILPPFSTPNGQTIGNVRIIENTGIPVGSALVGILSKFHVRNYKTFVIKYGYVDDDFEHNLFTVIGERRLHAYMYDNETAAIVYDTFANVKAAILQPA